MSCKVYDWKEKINEDELQYVINILNNSSVIIFPTDTVYGIGCNCFDDEAIKKIYSLKKRPNNKPINVLCDSLNKIELIAKCLNDKEIELIKKYMPGALTLIVNKTQNISDILTSNLDTVGVRIPNNDIALSILKECNYPLATSSVNISGECPSVKFEDFYDYFKDKVDVIIDGGESILKVASTIVKVEENDILVLREGMVKIDNKKM